MAEKKAEKTSKATKLKKLVVKTSLVKAMEFEKVSAERCEECGKALTKVKWISPNYPAPKDDLFGYFCTNAKCSLFRECQGTQGTPPAELRLVYTKEQEATDSRLIEAI